MSKYHQKIQANSLRWVIIPTLLIGVANIIINPFLVKAESEIIPDGDVTALINAIESANLNPDVDSIYLALNGTYNLTSTNNNTDGPNGLPSIKSPIQIHGNNATIQRTGSEEFRIFQISSIGELTLNDLTIRGGKTPDGADGINGSSAGSSYPGGGIYNRGILKLNHSNIMENATGNGGKGGNGIDGSIGISGMEGGTGGYGWPGGGIYNLGNLTLSHSAVMSNTIGNGGDGGDGGNGGGGGGDGGKGGSGGNTGSGGGIYSSGPEPLVINSSIISNNYIGNAGNGGNGGAPAIGDLVGLGGDGGDGGKSGNGGGITYSNREPLLINSSFVNNNYIGQGGNGGEGSSSGPLLTHGGKGGDGGVGGGICVQNNAKLFIYHSRIEKNTSGSSGNPGFNRFSDAVGGNGGGLYIHGNTLGITFSTIASNSTGAGSTTLLDSGGEGGAIFQRGSSVTINYSSVISNTTSDGGDGAAYAMHRYSSLKSMSVTNSTFSNNTTGLNASGGVFYFSHSTKDMNVILKSVTFSDNTSTSGGTIFHWKSIGYTPTFVLENVILNGIAPLFVNNGIGSINLIRNYTLASDDSLSTSGTGNINNIDPLIAPLADNGGPTLTHALLDGSPAIDAGYCPKIRLDQRYFPRPFDEPGIPNVADGCDVGAYEQGPDWLFLFTPIIMK